MENIKIRRIVNAVGLKGDVKVYNYSDYKERFEEIDEVLIERRDGIERLNIESVRYQKNMVILKLEGVDDRTGAEKLKEHDVFIGEDDLRVLPEDTFYLWDLEDCLVINTDTGETLGKVKDVLQNSAHDIYEIELSKGGTAMIPAVEEFIKKVDVQEKKIYVKLIPGLID